MLNIEKLFIFTIILVLLIQAISLPSAEAGAVIFEILKEEPGVIIMKFGDAKDIVELSDGDRVHICNKLLEDDVLLTIRDSIGNVFYETNLEPSSCIEEVLGKNLLIGDSELPGGGTQYKVSGGSFILLNACSVNPGKLTSFSFGTCPEDNDQEVGGEIIQINSASLLLAGIKADNFMLISFLIVGISFTVLMIQRKEFFSN